MPESAVWGSKVFSSLCVYTLKHPGVKGHVGNISTLALLAWGVKTFLSLRGGRETISVTGGCMTENN